jgi:hypothetical protein
MPTADDERLPKLLLMLSSNHDGEVIAAARAIGRRLRESGRDWHWLAGRVQDSEHEQDRPTPRDDEYATAADRRMINELFAARYELRPRDADFVEQMHANVSLYGDETFLSPKQRSYLHALHRKQSAQA